mgnify:CR=1 FL=1
MSSWFLYEGLESAVLSNSPSGTNLTNLNDRDFNTVYTPGIATDQVVTMDLGSARTCNSIILHNIGAFSTFNASTPIQYSSDNFVADTNTVAVFSSTYSSGSDIAYATFTSASARYWRTKTTWSSGQEIGNMFPGTRFQPSINYTRPVDWEPQMNNILVTAYSGRTFAKRQEPFRWRRKCIWRGLTSTDATNFRAFIEAIEVNIKAFYFIDPVEALHYYVRLASTPKFTRISYSVYDIEIDFLQEL